MSTIQHPPLTSTPLTDGATAAGIDTAARITHLAFSHRATQAAHCDALATGNPVEVDATRTRLDRITEALHDVGEPELADALAAEGQTGAVLLTLLTADDDTSGTQLGDGLASFQRCRHTVDVLLTYGTDGTHSV